MRKFPLSPAAMHAGPNMTPLVDIVAQFKHVDLARSR